MNASTGRTRWAAWMAVAIAGLKDLGPYAAIEIILPGGTLIALALFLYRRHKARAAGSYNLKSCATCA